jgi:hypothetical protein
MKPGLLYILLVGILFLIALTKPSDHQNVHRHFSTCQSIAKYNSDGLATPGKRIAPKQFFIELNFLRLHHEESLKNASHCRIDLSPAFIKLYHTNSHNKKFIIQYPILPVVRSCADKEDHDNLS